MMATLSLARHLAWYDLRATRVFALLWLLVVVFEVALVLAGPFSLGDGSSRVDDLLSMVFEIARILGAAVLTALIVQRDPLADPTAFWRTRPISRVSLWLSKMASVLSLIVMVPALALTAALSMASVSAADAFRQGLDLAVDHAGFMALGLAFAVPTLGITQAVTAAFAAGLSLIVAGALLDVMRTPGMTLWTQPSDGEFAVIGIAGVAAINAVHYLTLRRRLATGLTAALALLLLVTTALGVQRGGPSRTTAGPELVPPGSVTASLEPGAWRSAAPDDRRGDRFRAPIAIVGADPSLMFLPLAVSGTTLRRQSTAIELDANIDASWDGFPRATAEDAPFKNIRAVLGVELLATAPDSAATMRRALSVHMSRALYDETQSGPEAALSAGLDLAVHRLVTFATVPLVRGARVPARGGSVRVADVQVSTAGEVLVDLHRVRGRDIDQATTVLKSADGRWGVVADRRSGATEFGPGREIRRLSMGGWWMDLGSTLERLTFTVPPEARVDVRGQLGRASVIVFDVVDTMQTHRVTLDATLVGDVPAR